MIDMSCGDFLSKQKIKPFFSKKAEENNKCHFSFVKRARLSGLLQQAAYTY
jgi:hypothetical protein